jgi:hypothetical protein
MGLKNSCKEELREIKNKKGKGSRISKFHQIIEKFNLRNNIQES